jgi:hypothetical protein
MLAQMRHHISAAALVLAFTTIGVSPARAQVLVETGVISKKTKDLGDMIDKAWKEPKPDGGAQPKVTTAPKAGKKTVATSSRPKVLPDVFDPDTEDPTNVLDISADVMTRFLTALRAEVASRGDQKTAVSVAKSQTSGAEVGGFTPRQYLVLKARVRPFCDAIGAGQPPPNTLQLSYMPTEVTAIKSRCPDILPLLSGVSSK